MGKITLVRIPENMYFSDTLLKSLGEIFTEGFYVEKFATFLDLKSSYIRRAESLKQGFLFILTAFPLIELKSASLDINKYLDFIFMQMQILPSGLPIQHYEEALFKYTGLLVELVHELWKINHKDAIEWLNKAEQYHIMQTGRPDLATLIPTRLKGKEDIRPESPLEETEYDYIMQWEKQLPPFSSETLADLHVIKTRPTSECPIWYQQLKDYEQHFLRISLLKVTDIEMAFTFLPSRLRSIPALANFSEHHLLLLDHNGKKISSLVRHLRSSHLASPEVEKESADVPGLHCWRNLKQIHAQAPESDLFLGTLISPMRFGGSYMPVAGMIRDPYLFKQLLQTVELFKQDYPQVSICMTNHPINHIAGYLNMTQAKDAQCENFLTAIEKMITVTTSNELRQNLILLTTQYRKLLASGFGTATIWDYRGRELWLSSLENVMFSLADGQSWLACMEGKDRTSYVIMHADAIRLYKSYYKEWPSIEDDSRAREKFIALLAQLYESGHAQCIASQNAPGAFGLRSLELYWPKDIQEKISEKRAVSYQIDHTLACYNEVHKCLNQNKLRAKFSGYLLVALKLSEKNIHALLGELAIRIEHAYKNQTNTGLWLAPPSITQRLHELIRSDNSSIEKLALIYYEMLFTSQNLFSSSKSSLFLQNLVKGLTRLSVSSEPNEEINRTLLSVGYILKEFPDTFESLSFAISYALADDSKPTCKDQEFKQEGAINCSMP